MTESRNEKIKGDTRILEVLIEKDEQAAKNINDPSDFSKVYDLSEDEEITADAIEKGMKPEEFNKALETDINPLDILLGKVDMPKGESSRERTKRLPTLFKNDFEYVKAAIEFLKTKEGLQASFNNDSRRVEITATDDLRHRMYRSGLFAGIISHSQTVLKMRRHLKADWRFRGNGCNSFCLL